MKTLNTTAAIDLPFDLDDVQPATSADPMARAGELARAAMLSQMPTAEQVAQFRAERKAEEDRIRAKWQADHAARNAERAAAAAQARANRIAAHNARNASARSASNDNMSKAA